MITVKEEFLDSPKWKRAVELGGSDAIVMWLALKGYAASNPTDGFIADDDVDRVPGAPKSPRKALQALVECGRKNRDGSRGAGLVDPVQHGWQLHDYLDHATSSKEVEERRRKAKERKDRWLARNADGTRSEPGTERIPERVAERVPEPVPNAFRNAPRNGSRTRPPAGGPARVPSPAQPNQLTSDVAAKEPDTSTAAEPVPATAAAVIENHEQALEAIQEDGAAAVAELCRDEALADRLEAQRFPFVVRVLKAFHEAKKREGSPRIGRPSEAADVRAVLLVTALGYLPSDLVRVAKYLPTTEKFQNKATAAIMTPNVVAIALNELQDGDTRVAGLVRLARAGAEDDRGGAPQPLSASLARFAAGGGGDA